MIPKVQALEKFELIWRFSDASKYTQLTPSEFIRFCPISPEESLKLWEQYVYASSGPLERHLSLLYSRNFISWPNYNYPKFWSVTENQEEQLIAFLKNEVPETESSELLFFWHAELCVRTDWGLFLEHWDDFCYPSDNSNIIILPDINKVIIYIEDMWHILPRKHGQVVFTKD